MTRATTEEHPLVERYLGRLQEGLKSMAPADREEAVRDIRSHIAEATAAGATLESVLTTLGPAEVLARAYTVELLLNPAPGRQPMSGSQRFFALAGIVALTSIPTMVVTVTLGSMGVSFIASGLVVFLAGVVDAVGLTLPFTNGPVTEVHPALAIAAGPALFAVGVLELWALSKYLKWFARTISRTLPR